ncbi:MAG: hypothetical protein WD063_00395 [Pirellulales bacterium]
MEGTCEISLIDRLKSTKEGRHRLLTERAIVRVTKQLEEAMDAKGVSRSELAVLLNRSKGWVTQLLDGENNKTIRTVAYVFAVLGAQFETGFTFPANAQPVVTGETARVAFDITTKVPWGSKSPGEGWPGVLAIEGVVPRFDNVALTSIADVN